MNKNDKEFPLGWVLAFPVVLAAAAWFDANYRKAVTMEAIREIQQEERESPDKIDDTEGKESK